MTPLNVMHVARAPYTGVWTLMRQLVRWQMSQGYRVALGLLLPKSWPVAYREQLTEIQSEGCTVYTCPSPDIFGTGAFLFHQLNHPVWRWARSFADDAGKPPMIHFHNAWLSGAYLPGTYRVAGCVATYHGIQGQAALRQQPIRRAIHRYWAHRLVKNSVSLISVDPGNPQIAEDLFGVPAALFKIVRNGVATPLNGLLGAPRLRDPARPFTVGHVGIVAEGKGWRVTGAALDILRAQGLPVQFLIAGGGPEAELAAAWCAQRSEWARYLGNLRDPVSEVFTALDLLVLPSLREGLPMAVLEALSLGIPVLATAVGGLPDAIADGKNGFLVRRDPGAIADRTREIMESAALHDRLSNGARSVHAERFSTDVMGDAYEGVYLGVSAPASNGLRSWRTPSSWRAHRIGGGGTRREPEYK